MAAEELDLLGCCAMWLGNFTLCYEETYRLHLQGYEEIHGFITQMKALRPFETSESNYPTTWCKNP
jgi:hypothetical protein